MMQVRRGMLQEEVLVARPDLVLDEADVDCLGRPYEVYCGQSFGEHEDRELYVTFRDGVVVDLELGDYC